MAPRVAHLLGLDEGAVGDRQDLFAAWRLFFERLADVYPTVLAFEDMQWADACLLDFVEYLLEWSRDSPLYVITLARPELQEQRPSWGAGQRNFTSLYLEPLSGKRWGTCSRGSYPGCRTSFAHGSSSVRREFRSTRSRRCGCCSTAGCSSRKGLSYRPTGEIETLEVPETLHALIAARLDGARRRGTAAAAGRRCAREDVHAPRSPPSPPRRRATSRRCSPASCGRRCSASSPIRARPSAGSTGSCRTWFGTSHTRRSRSGSGRPPSGRRSHLAEGLPGRGRGG